MNKGLKFFLIIFLLAGLTFSNCFTLPSFAFYTGDKVLFVEISTDWCFACKMLKPVVEELKKEYTGKVEFVQLDPSGETKASEYGVSSFFNQNRGVFPTVGVITQSGKVEKIIVGANKKGTYEEILNSLLSIDIASKNTAASSPDNEATIIKTEEGNNGRPEEPQNFAGRPQEEESSGRPSEIIAQGRPSELRFWSFNQPIPPCYASRLIVLPICSDGNNILCASNINSTASQAKGKSEDNPAVYKPWTPFATRDEKGLTLKKR